MGNESNNPPLVRQLMDRIRTEVQRSRTFQPGSSDGIEIAEISAPTCAAIPVSQELTRRNELPPSLQLHLTDPEPIESPLTQFKIASNSRYRVEDLVAFNDREFVTVAYRALLLRRPDDGGFNNYLHHLRNGTSKEEILYILRESAEGRVTRVTVSGLSRRMLLIRASRLPLVGRLVALGRGIWNLPQVEQQIRAAEGRLIALIERSHNSLGASLLQATRALREVEDGYGKLTNYAASKTDREVAEGTQDSIRKISAELDSLTTTSKDKATKSEVARLHKAFAELNSRFADDEKSVREVRTILAELKSTQGSRASTIELADLKNSNKSLTAELEIFRKGIETIHAAVAELRTLTNSRAAALDVSSLFHAHTALSAQFENDRQSLKNAQEAIGAVREGLIAAESTLASLSRTKADQTELAQTRADNLASQEFIRSEVRSVVDRAILSVYEQLHSRTESYVSRNELLSIGGEFSAAMKTAIDAFRESLAQLAATKANIGDLERTRQDLQSMIDVISSDAIRDRDATLRDLNAQFESLSRSKADIEAVEKTAIQFGASLESTRQESQEALERTSNSLSIQAHDLRVNLLDQERRLMLLLVEARKRLPLPMSQEQIAKLSVEEDHLLDSMYASFEDRFRGTRADIKSYQANYLPHIREAKAGLKENPIIDLGCGRGEWLEVLRDEGLFAQGTDKNRVFLEVCRELNLNVVEQDALALLQGRKPNSVGAVTAFHIIEHLQLKTLIAVLDESLRVLKPGGVLIVETPNPENIVVGACNFYYDPTHVRPLPPQSTQFLLEARGFVNVAVMHLHPNARFAFLKAEIPGLAPLFSNGQDYALIAKKA